VPAEADVTLSATGEWYWRAGQPLKSLAALSTLYDNSVGHNSNLLLNFGPAFSGALPDAAVKRYEEFGDWIRGCYGAANAIAETRGAGILKEGESIVLNLTSGSGGSSRSAGSSHSGAGSKDSIDQHAAKLVDRIVLMEDQSAGQRIRSYTVEYLHNAAGDKSGVGVWTAAATAESLGHKRIFKLPIPMPLRAVRVTLLQAVNRTATIRRFSAFANAGCKLPPSPPSPPCTLLSDYKYGGTNLAPSQVSGVSHCHSPLPALLSCLLSLAFLLPQHAADKDACCSLCRAAKACVAFYFDAGACQLLKSIGGGQAAAGVVSGAPLRED
jgi:hypothetical protein